MSDDPVRIFVRFESNGTWVITEVHNNEHFQQRTVIFVEQQPTFCISREAEETAMEENDPDERMFFRMVAGLEPNLSFEDACYFRMEHAIKMLAKRNGGTEEL